VLTHLKHASLNPPEFKSHANDISIDSAVFGRPFVKPFSLSHRCPVVSVCNVGVLWPNGWMDQDETWHGGRLGPGRIVLDEDPVL